MPAVDEPIMSALIMKFVKSGTDYEDFFKQKDDAGWEETVMFALNLILKDSDFQHLKIQNQKDEIKSIALKNTGNEALKSNDLEAALAYYTQSIGLAPCDSNVLALGYANRGAVLKRIGYFKESIIDTQQAIALNYPQELLYKLFTRLGQCFQQLGRLEEASESFNHALKAINVDSCELTRAEKKKLRKCIKKDMARSVSNVVPKQAVDDDEWAIQLAGVPDVSPAPPPRLSYGSNDQFPSISKYISLKYSDHFGRHLVAENDIKPGDVVIVEKSCCALLQKNQQFTHCNHCFQYCWNLIPCATCAWCMYCSKECLEADQECHKIECSLMPIFQESDISPSSELVLRLVSQMGTKALCEAAENYKEMAPTTPEEWLKAGMDKEKFSGLNGVLSFKSSRVKNSSAMIMAYCIFVASITRLLNLHSLPCNLKVQAFLLRLLCCLKDTTHPLTEFQIFEIETRALQVGHTLIAATALLNHSCNPNVAQHHHKSTTVVRAIQVIPKGSQLFISYGRTFQKFPKSVRSKVINPILGIACNCEACENNWPVFDELALAPTFNLPQDRVGFDRMTASQNQIQHKAMVNTSLLVNKTSLPVLLKHIILSDTLNAKHNQSYHNIVDNVRIYFAMQGNIRIHK